LGLEKWCQEATSIGGGAMKFGNRWLVVIPIIAGLQLSACQRESAPPEHVAPAHVEHLDGSEKVVPYGAVIYDAYGGTWVYTSPEPRVFVRHEIDIDYIDGDMTVLSHGPDVGTAVVTVGVAELFGTEFEIGH
jgi:hypothetical protein